jgi:xylitol oxidase
VDANVINDQLILNHPLKSNQQNLKLTMKRRYFLKTSSAIVSGSLLSAPFACTPNSPPRTNWAGNLTYSTDNLHRPKTIEALQEVIRKCDKARALGTRHSFNSIADSTDNQVSLQHLNQAVTLDEEANTVTCSGGMRYGELCLYLHDHGYALHNLASLPHISVAGACATATHGSGDRNGNLATPVAALEIVTADGELLSLSRDKDPEKFHGAVVGLGGLGIVAKVTLDVQPTFEMRQDVFLDLPLDQMEQHFDDIFSSGYSVSFFTDWREPRINQVWVKSRLDAGNAAEAPAELYGARPAIRDVHPIIDLSAENCTKQMGVPGPWYDRLPHFRLGFTPSSGEELQSEYFVPRQNAVDAILAIQRMGEKVSPHLFISEIRSIDADGLWMSPCFQQPSVALHFTWKPDWPAVQKLLPQIEAELAPFNVKPHWGKLFTLDPATLQSRYEKLEDFRQLLDKYDPEGKFRNEFLEKNIIS